MDRIQPNEVQTGRQAILGWSAMKGEPVKNGIPNASDFTGASPITGLSHCQVFTLVEPKLVAERRQSRLPVSMSGVELVTKNGTITKAGKATVAKLTATQRKQYSAAAIEKRLSRTTAKPSGKRARARNKEAGK